MEKEHSALLSMQSVIHQDKGCDKIWQEKRLFLFLLKSNFEKTYTTHVRT